MQYALNRLLVPSCARCFHFTLTEVTAWLQAVDELLWAWDASYGKLQAAEAAYKATGCKKRPAHYLKRWRCRGDFACRAAMQAGCVYGACFLLSVDSAHGQTQCMMLSPLVLDFRRRLSWYHA